MITSTSSNKEPGPTPDFDKQRDATTKMFDSWTEQEQVDFVEHLLARMCHYQHGQVNTFLKPMLQRDFISALPGKCSSQYSILYPFIQTAVKP